MEVKPGYKQTEVGVIPEEWESSKLGDFSFVTKLAGFEYTIHFDYSKSGPVIAVRALNIKNGTLDIVEVHTIPRKTSDDLPRSKLAKGDLVISYVGTLGRVAMIPEDNKFHLAPNVAKICVDKARVAPEFLAQFLNSFNGQKLIFDAAASTTQAALSMRNLRGIAFVRPPLPEQRAIAGALGDVDALLGALENLIAKKRDLKQAAMQQLLAGQTRLPGFDGEWEVKRLGNLFEITSSKRVFQSEWKSEGIPFYRARELAVLGETGRVDNELFITKSLYDSFRTAHGVPEVGDMLVTGVGTLGKVYVVRNEEEFYFKDGNVIWFKIRGAVSPEFLRQLYLTKVVMKQITDAAAGTTVGTYTISGANKTEIPFPPLLEQTAIAEVLSDMDAELSALEQRRDKTLSLKQGMMQELLTGRTRLI